MHIAKSGVSGFFGGLSTVLILFRFDMKSLAIRFMPSASRKRCIENKRTRTYSKCNLDPPLRTLQPA